MAKYVVKRGSKKLSGYYPNDIKGVFAFRKNDYITFDKKEGAEHFIEQINKEVNEKENQERYGEKHGKLNKSIAKNLKVEEKL